MIPIAIALNHGGITFGQAAMAALLGAPGVGGVAGAALAALLLGLRHATDPDHLTAVSTLILSERPDGPLFLNSDRKPWTRNAVRIRFRNLCKKHPELKGIIAYSYRSSFATDALDQGVPDATVAAILGHTNTATLHKYYARLSGRLGHLKDAAAKATQKPPAGAAPAGTP